MSDLLDVVVGVDPWHPPHANLIEVLDRYDMPLMTLLEASGRYYLARCVFGQIDDHQLWIYPSIEDNDVARLQSSSNDDLAAIADGLAVGYFPVAIAGPRGVIASDLVEIPPGVSWLDMLKLVTERLMERALETVRETERLKAELGGGSLSP